MLLLLDPSSHYDMLRTAEGGMTSMAHIRKSIHTFKAKKYQLVTVRGIMTSDSEFEVSEILSILLVLNIFYVYV